MTDLFFFLTNKYLNLEKMQKSFLSAYGYINNFCGTGDWARASYTE